MKKPLLFAIGLQVLIMLAVLIPPLLTLQTGQKVYLENQRVDPRSLLRGDYVILDYKVGLKVPYSIARKAFDEGKLLYVTVTTDRPGSFVSASMQKPILQDGQACITARPSERVQWDFAGMNDVSWVMFPQISQYFVEEGTGTDIERDINNMVTELSVTKGCNSVVRGIELL